MKELIEYLISKNIFFNPVDDDFIEIDSKRYFLVRPDDDGVLFTDDFVLIADEQDCERYVYNFGGVWYWENKDDYGKPKLNELLYIGETIVEVNTECFLGVRGAYEILNGSRMYSDWVNKAKFLGVKSLGICEKNTLAGVLKFQLECQKEDIKPIIGATYTVFRESDDFKYELKFFVKNETGWNNLLMLNKEVNVINNKFVPESKLPELVDGLIVVVDPKYLSFTETIKLNNLINIDYYQLDTVEYNNDDRDREYLDNLKKFVLSKMKPASITDAFYLEPEHSYVKRLLNSISGVRDYESDNQYFKDKDDYCRELEILFNSEDDSYFRIASAAIKNEKVICNACDFQVTLGKRFLPKYKMKEEEKAKFKDNEDLFWHLIETGLKTRVKGSNISKYIERVEKEMNIIKKGDVIDYFLILWDIINYARSKDILLGIARGSAGGCLVAFLCGITQIDPMKFDLLFERFLNEGRIEKTIKKNFFEVDLNNGENITFDEDDSLDVIRSNKQVSIKAKNLSNSDILVFEEPSMIKSIKKIVKEVKVPGSLPDIDTDFQGVRREEIKQYMEERYGVTQVCSVGTYTALQVKASIKDIGKQLGINFSDINQVTTLLPQTKSINELFSVCSSSGRIKSFVKHNVELINSVRLVLHQPKAKSVHACAMLILPDEKEMFEWVPIVDIDGQMVSEWEGPELEAAGFLKEDILGILQLDKFENILRLIKENRGINIDIYNIPLDDKRVYDYFSKGWNEDVFHFGSRGLTGYCKELKPENVEDLIAGISLYRPGAMENNFHNEYILRKTGKREVEYFVGSENILNKTYGVFVYQEQIMKLCQVLGGLSLVEADDVRKAMVKKKYSELTKYKERFIPYYIENFGVTKEYSENVWDAIDKASTYLFNRSHAAAYAITGYISQWLKVNYPIEYWSAAFKFSEDKDYANFISEINLSGNINVLPADINKSRDDVYTDFKEKTIYWPLISIKQLGEKAASQIIELRDKDGQYFSFEEFIERNKFKGSKVTKQVVENLIISGAFDNVENINTFKDRFNLVKNYRKLNKIKIDHDKDLFELNGDKVYYDWWWILQQKRLSGIAFFDYRSLCEQYLESDLIYVEAEDFQLESYSDSRLKAKIGGYITEIEERNGKKGKWARITLENNYTFITVTVWAEQYKQLQDMDIINKSKSLMLLTGQIVYDSFKKENILQVLDDTEFIILI